MRLSSVLMMIVFSTVFLSGCLQNTSKDQNVSGTSVKQQIAQRNQEKDAGLSEDANMNEKKIEDTNGGNVEGANTDDQGVSPDVLASCLTKKSWKMYGTNWCGFCKQQKEAFGDAFKDVDFIDCDQEKQVCADAGIKGYPTWVSPEGKSYPGVQSLEKLARLSGCEQ